MTDEQSFLLGLGLGALVGSVGFAAYGAFWVAASFALLAFFSLAHASDGLKDYIPV